jgi:hypothetical protein
MVGLAAGTSVTLDQMSFSHAAASRLIQQN